MQIRPLSDRVVLRIDAEPDVTPGGLHLPERRAARSLREGTVGRVIAVGPGRRDERGRLVPMSVAPGDRVLFELYAAGNDVPTPLVGARVAIIRDGDVLAVFEPQPVAFEVGCRRSPEHVRLAGELDGPGPFRVEGVDGVGLPLSLIAGSVYWPIRFDADPDGCRGCVRLAATARNAAERWPVDLTTPGAGRLVPDTAPPAAAGHDDVTSRWSGRTSRDPDDVPGFGAP